jgi:hypothetical protein
VCEYSNACEYLSKHLISKRLSGFSEANQPRILSSTWQNPPKIYLSRRHHKKPTTLLPMKTIGIFIIWILAANHASSLEPPTLPVSSDDGGMVNLQLQLQWSRELNRWNLASAPVSVQFILPEGTETGFLRFQTVSISKENGLVSLQLQILQNLNLGGWNPTGGPINAQFPLPQGTPKAFFRFFVQQIPGSQPPGNLPNPPTTPPPSEPPPTAPPSQVPPPPPF